MEGKSIRITIAIKSYKREHLLKKGDTYHGAGTIYDISKNDDNLVFLIDSSEEHGNGCINGAAIVQRNIDVYDIKKGILICSKCNNTNYAMYDKCQNCGKSYNGGGN
jgi:hypothetical protein